MKKWWLEFNCPGLEGRNSVVCVSYDSREEVERNFNAVRDAIKDGHTHAPFEPNEAGSQFIVPLKPIPIVRCYEK